MGARLRPIGHEDRLSLVDHLDELRTRLIICVAVYAVAFGVCFWQNDRILGLLEKPLTAASTSAASADGDPLEQTSIWQLRMKALLGDLEAFGAAAARSGDAELRELARRIERSARAAEVATPDRTTRRPVTLGVGEPFFTTMRVSGWGALLVALPVLLFQVYAFVLPAFSPTERRVALPLMGAVPLLFVAGVCFAYFLVLPNAVYFLQNFNDDNFDILLQAKDFYRFSIMVLLAMGLLFQIPVGILATTRVGIVSVSQLRRNRRYAVLVIAVLAMLLPGQDPVTLVLAMAPLIVLYEGSILLAALLDRRAARARIVDAAEMTAANDAELEPLDPDHSPDRL